MRNSNKSRLKKSTVTRALFFAAIVTLPLIQYSCMSLGTKINAIIMSFQKYDYASSGVGYDITFAGFKNFIEAFKIIAEKGYMVRISLLGFLVMMCVSYPLAMIFSYYIYKKFPLSGFFRVILFLPQVISSLIFATLFKYMVGTLYMEVTGAKQGLLSNPDTALVTVLFFNVWVSFGINVLMFSNAMGNIDESVVESAQLDGVNIWQEFIHITVPGAWTTIVSCVIISTVGIFTNQMYMFDMFGEGARFEIASLGYFLYQKASVADYVQTATEPSLSILSALGLIFTIILMVASGVIKKLLTKFGPSVD